MTHELHTIGIIQVKAYRILQAEVSAVIKSFGLGSVSEWFVLNHVFATSGVMAKDLAALLEVEAPLISRLVNNLVTGGYVEIGNDPNDKRAKFIIPTKKATVLVQDVQAALEKNLSILLRGVSDTDMAAYLRVLESIIKNRA